jgi:hypothetical protein
MRWCCERCTAIYSSCMRFVLCCLVQGMFGNSAVVIAPSTSVLAPMIRGEPDNPRAVKSRGNPRWWSNTILSPRKTGGFFRGARHTTPRQSRTRHVNVVSIRGSTRQSRPLTGTGALSRCRLPGYMPSLWLSVGRSFTTPVQPVPIPSTRFFFLFDSPYSSLRTLDTSPSGALTGVTGLMGSLLDLKRRSRGC